jgi:hypothetical protein
MLGSGHVIRWGTPTPSASKLRSQQYTGSPDCEGRNSGHMSQFHAFGRGDKSFGEGFGAGRVVLAALKAIPLQDPEFVNFVMESVMKSRAC